ncbi:hypothetical protein AVJ23_04380 [Pseudoponticoccus marisrubri]|uniref:Uncharacterized protein n=1 Tax=Pseudoponticoccus marisrubri TaxID=1685382 RepID=A0A0W7WML2_9RHOB|nr:hypothetical protein AVJ23_04380 [Pseudoponticoccus marisrubri]
MLSLTFGVLAGAAGAGPIETVTEGAGPGERVVAYRLAPDALPLRAGDTDVLALAGEISDRQGAAATQAALEAGLTLFGDGFGGAGAVGTLAENVGGIAALGGINSIMTYAGVVFTGVLVANDLAQGKPDSAAINAYKGMVGFAISKYGWSALQTSATTLFIFDVTLREVASGGREIYEDRWREAVKRTFREDRDLARSAADWHRIVWDIYLRSTPAPGEDRAAGINPFAATLEAELDAYVARVTLDKVALHDEATRLAGGGSGLSRTILDGLRAEHKARLSAWIARSVLPSIAKRARERQLHLLVQQMNAELKPEMNRTITLEVTAWDMPGATLRLPGADGTDWGGPLGADGSFTLEFTRFAWMKAGLPRQILLETGQGTVLSAPLSVMGDRAAAIFGEPRTPLVSRMTLREDSRLCWLTRLSLAREPLSTRALRLSTPAEQQLDAAQLPGGQVVVGRYDGQAQRWLSAAPAVWLYDTQLHLGAPRDTALAVIKDCEMTMFSGDRMMQGSCTFVHQRERLRANDILQMRCSNRGTVSYDGVFADMGDGFAYHPYGGDTGAMANEALREGMRRGLPGLDSGALEQNRLMIPQGGN